MDIAAVEQGADEGPRTLHQRRFSEEEHGAFESTLAAHQRLPLLQGDLLLGIVAELPENA